MKSTYKSAGVDIKAGDLVVKNIRALVKSTFNKNVLSGIGHFGSFYRIEKKKYHDPVLVSSVDGVGTKLKIAIAMDKHDTIGQDLVNHCVNDIAVCGAKPLYFMDYLAFGKLNPIRAQKIIEGFTIACRENGVALVGGETAEMPGLYSETEYDISGTIVGIVEKKKIIYGTKVKKGNVLIGFASNGLHTNGYSLARKVLFGKFKVNNKPEIIEGTIGLELLKVHKSYLKLIRKIITKINVKAFSHITGGGIVGNTKRVVPNNLKLKIDWNSWDMPNIFKLIQETGDISNNEMRKVFNLGIGLITIVDKKEVNVVLEIAKSLNEKAFIIGNVL